MTTRADYTGEEWTLLVDAPQMVGLGMLTVSGSGPVGKLRELLALRRCLRLDAATDDMRRNQLIMAILRGQEARKRELQETLAVRGNSVPFMRMVIAAHVRMVGHTEKVARLLADKAPYAEAQEVKRWLMWIARRVAGASGDGWLGTGQKLSDRENHMLDRVAAALGIVTVVDALTPAGLEVLLGAQRETTERTGMGEVGGAEGTENVPRGNTKGR